jgi:beta-lactamase class D
MLMFILLFPSLFLRYPQCLYFLEQLQKESFRQKLKQIDFINSIHENQVNLWTNLTTVKKSLLEQQSLLIEESL